MSKVLFRRIANSIHSGTPETRLTREKLSELLSIHPENIIPTLPRPPAASPAAVLISFFHHPQHPMYPSMLFTVRSNSMRSHTGQVSFPGGRLDPDVDKNDLVTCALRETMEEIGIQSSSIDVLTPALNPVVSRDGRSVAHPVVAYLNWTPSPSSSPSSRILAAKGWPDSNGLYINPDEVDLVFYMTLDDLLSSDTTRRRRMRYPSKFAKPGPLIHEWRVPDDVQMYLSEQRSKNGSNARMKESNELWIWGLTSFMVECILRRILHPDTIREQLDDAIPILGPRL